MSCFSQKLIEDFKAYWLKRFKEKVSTEQAEKYLVSLAELFLSFSNIKK
ncbi:hypothetical protein KJ786_01440 [Patescibacteria group bacterium]|nr:hypothetical protein [Patescibacteria group bacterium]